MAGRPPTIGGYSNRPGLSVINAQIPTPVREAFVKRAIADGDHIRYALERAMQRYVEEAPPRAPSSRRASRRPPSP
jgi:hypothetical protein